MSPRRFAAEAALFAVGVTVAGVFVAMHLIWRAVEDAYDAWRVTA